MQLETCDIILADALLDAPLQCLLRQIDGEVSGVLVLVIQAHLANQLFVDHIPHSVAGEHEPRAQLIMQRLN